MGGRVRLDKYLVETGGISRSQAQRAVRAGRVSVDGEVLRNPAHQLSADSVVCLDGEARALRGPRYLLLHKPAGYVCATRDDLHPTVLELLPPAERDGLHIVGRLDMDTTGLVLLTDDGAWSHRVASPRHRCDKRYRVTLAEPVSDADIERLQTGLLLRGESRPTRPAEVERLAECELLLTIQEGRYHQVKRMFGALGNRVVGLHRDRIGSVQLDEAAVPPGEFRALSPAEVAALG
jgi:16S rRNA pseudouridine516 synthase